MRMKGHILMALREQFNHWEELLISMGEEKITELRTLSDWSTKDVMAHLWAWQQISIARLQAAVEEREPRFPGWVTELDPGWEDDADQSNAAIYEKYHPKPWAMIYPLWREGFLRFLKLGESIHERDLLDTSRYPWLGGHSLALILIASYDHHQEHLEKLIAWLEENHS